jgi:hypothetical protein
MLPFRPIVVVVSVDTLSCSVLTVTYFPQLSKGTRFNGTAVQRMIRISSDEFTNFSSDNSQNYTSRIVVRRN